MRPYIFVILAALSAATTSAQSIPPAVFTDPPADAAHPAQMTALHIPTQGVQINGIIYQPSGAGPHPTLVICHGLPGNEKFLDLAQAVRRSGWNAVAFNYRGSWGSPGVFRFSQNLEDADAVLAYLRDPANAKRLGIDTHRIALAGHSMGGWVVVHTASHDHGLIGAVIISAADVGKQGELPRDRLLALMRDSMGPLAGVTPEGMADQVRALGKKFRFENAAAGLTQTPLLALTADDGLAPDTDALVRAIQTQGGHDVTAMHVHTDHSWSEHRIALESTIITWLGGLGQRSARCPRGLPIGSASQAYKIAGMVPPGLVGNGQSHVAPTNRSVIVTTFLWGMETGLRAAAINLPKSNGSVTLAQPRSSMNASITPRKGKGRVG